MTEAKHLEEFGSNFRHWSGVTFPQVAGCCFGPLLVSSAAAAMSLCGPASSRRQMREQGAPALLAAAEVHANDCPCLSRCPACHATCLQPADAPLVSSEVLVETFEEGELISK